MTPSTFPTVELEGVRLDAVDEEQCVASVLAASAAGHGGWIITPNLDHLRRLHGDPSLRARYARADLVVADGMPLVWACRLQNTPLPGRVAGSDLIWSLSRAAAERGLSVFFLGGDPGTAEEAARVLRGRFEHLQVAGVWCPSPGFENRPSEVGELAARLALARANLIFVALGSPKQEALIERLRSDFPAAWWMGVGISFSFVAGRVQRAPVWLRRIGGEWIHRMVQEPRRLARRYLLEGVPFGAALITRSALRGLRSRVSRRSRPC
jgi:N-acetylglucosaminyldiphosphoundecaprenol N-acetyl-beta-D-mannosaminyltransferase